MPEVVQPLSGSQEDGPDYLLRFVSGACMHHFAE